MRIRPVFKCFGGKHYLAEWIISLFPPGYQSEVYVEPFLGGGSVLLNKKKGVEEWGNDLDPGVISIWKAVRDTPSKFEKEIKKLKYEKEVFEEALQEEVFRTDLERGVNEYVRKRMSRGGMGKVFAWSNRLRGGKPGDVNGWETAADNIHVISDRIQGVSFQNKPAMEILKAFNFKYCLAYLDPPYLPDSRVSKNVYRYEMKKEDHYEFLQFLKHFKAKVIISGYSSELYNVNLKDWRREVKKIKNHASQASKKGEKEEVVWMNYNPDGTFIA